MKKFQRLLICLLAVSLVVAMALLVACDEKFSVVFYDGNTEVSSISVKSGEALAEDQIPSAPNGHEGEVFEGWFVGDTKVEAGYKPAENVTATAKWSTAKSVYTVTLDAGDEFGGKTELQAEEGANLSQLLQDSAPQ